MDNQTRPTHQVIANRLGTTVATVSRLRSGERLPSVEMMVAIKNLVAWSIDHQASAKHSGTYHTEFERYLDQWWNRQTDAESAKI